MRPRHEAAEYPSAAPEYRNANEPSMRPRHEAAEYRQAKFYCNDNSLGVRLRDLHGAYHPSDNGDASVDEAIPENPDY